MDDNVRNPKSKVEAKDQVKKLLEVVRDTKYLYKYLNMPALNRSFAGNSAAPVSTEI